MGADNVLCTRNRLTASSFTAKSPFTLPCAKTALGFQNPTPTTSSTTKQYDILARASQGKAWTFCEIRPDVIVGFVAQNNSMNMAQGLALFFSLYREVEGEGAEVCFPYGEEAWTALHTDSSADVLGRFHVFASLAPMERVAGRAFNVVDGPATTWRELWPRLAGYFGLLGVGPGSTGCEGEEGFVKRWVEERRGLWASLQERGRLRDGVLEGTSFEFVDDVVILPVRRYFDSTARKEVGFVEERDQFDGYRIAFDEMRAAGTIP